MWVYVIIYIFLVYNVSKIYKLKKKNRKLNLFFFFGE